MCKTEFRKLNTNALPSDSDLHQYKNLICEPDSSLEIKAFKTDLWQQIHKLSHDHKVVFILRYHQQFSMKEIAAITESNIGTVKSRLFYATQNITKALKTYQPENDSAQFKMN
jgi:RNA polymerase sigma-70 factor (ECF subfamily)